MSGVFEIGADVFFGPLTRGTLSVHLHLWGDLLVSTSRVRQACTGLGMR